MNRLSVKHCTKKFTSKRRTITALNNVHLTVEPGEFFILLGPSGCGKSTLLATIAGIEEPDSGLITLGERTLYSDSNRVRLSPKERNVAMVFQNYALYPHMTVAENIGFPLKMSGSKKGERLRAVEETASLLSLRELLNARPAELSGGQRQRVAIARAIVRKPDLFLLDEPLSNLDAKLRAETRGNLKTLQRKLGITTLYVTHDQVEAMTLGDRIALLNNGQVEQVGTPQELYHNPATPFVAGFIGSPPMNLIPAEVKEDNGSFFSTIAGVAIDVTSAVKRQGSGAGHVQLGIRPEHLTIMDTADKTTVPAEVTSVENLGRETVVYAACGGTTIASIDGAIRTVTIGKTIAIQFSSKNIHIF